MRIELDPVLTPQENVERYYKRHRKLSRGIEHSLRRHEETQSELEWLEQLEYQLNSDLQKADLEDIAEELRAAKVPAGEDISSPAADNLSDQTE